MIGKRRLLGRLTFFGCTYLGGAESRFQICLCWWLCGLTFRVRSGEVMFVGVGANACVSTSFHFFARAINFFSHGWLT